MRPCRIKQVSGRSSKNVCRRGPPATAVNSGRYVCLGTAFTAARLHPSAQPEGALGKSEAWNRGWEAGFPCRKWAWRAAAGALVGRGAGAGLACRGGGGGACPRPTPARPSVPGGRRQRLEASPGFALGTSAAAAPQAAQPW